MAHGCTGLRACGRRGAPIRAVAERRRGAEPTPFRGRQYPRVGAVPKVAELVCRSSHPGSCPAAMRLIALHRRLSIPPLLATFPQQQEHACPLHPRRTAFNLRTRFALSCTPTLQFLLHTPPTGSLRRTRSLGTLRGAAGLAPRGPLGGAAPPAGPPAAGGGAGGVGGGGQRCDRTPGGRAAADLRGGYSGRRDGGDDPGVVPRCYEGGKGGRGGWIGETEHAVAGHWGWGGAPSLRVQRP